MLKHLYLIVRYLLGLLILTTAIGKLLDNRGFADVLETYQLGLSADILLFLGLGISLFELFLAIFIFLPTTQKWTSITTVLMHIGYTFLAIVTLSRGLDIPNCGCFGIFWARPMTITTVFEDLFLVAISGIFFVLSKKCGAFTVLKNS